MKSFKASAFAAVTLAFASFGDAFLYPFLPLNSKAVGIPVVYVGLILSINRFVRIFANALMVEASLKFGGRSIMIVAAMLAIISTFGYGLATGIFPWLMLRIVWGFAFSAMRIAVVGYALQHQRRGFAFGVSRSLQESGPMLSLLIAPLLLKYIDSTRIFYALSMLSVPALYFAWKLPASDEKEQTIEGTRSLRWPSTLNLITFFSAMVVEGIVVVVLGGLFFRYGGEIDFATATALAAIYLAYRRICLIVLSTAGGWVSDLFGMDRMFNISTGLSILGLVIIVSGWTGTGAVIVFTFYSIHTAITPACSARSRDPLRAIAENATWRDIGAAIGTLIGGLLIYSQSLEMVLSVAVLILVSLHIVHAGLSRQAIKLLHLWK